MVKLIVAFQYPANAPKDRLSGGFIIRRVPTTFALFLCTHETPREHEFPLNFV
jgi:hypothetical protein